MKQVRVYLKNDIDYVSHSKYFGRPMNITRTTQRPETFFIA